MKWDIINQDPPKCIFCLKTTNQMARFENNIQQYVYICGSCARFVKDCMNVWKDLKSTNYIDHKDEFYDADFHPDI